ncbi:uncharacterized protein P884DRAFT_300442 [Thermothelomyces heterothallicus CBS 202.75]|uniref:uncharacterized protein n=1 Tax=Thermothelomyces heterothallicus CBS 202.75 TaxID=1149848 RepID=UPI0037445073
MTYTGVLATIFTGVEPSVALSVACVPFLRPLIGRGGGGGGGVGKGTGTGTGTGGSSSYAHAHAHDSRRRRYGSGSGSGAGSALRGAGRSRQQEGFKELHDDSSEIQLRPVGADSPKYEADAAPENRQPTSESADGIIVVKKGWNVVSGSPSASS